MINKPQLRAPLNVSDSIISLSQDFAAKTEIIFVLLEKANVKT